MIEFLLFRKDAVSVFYIPFALLFFRRWDIENRRPSIQTKWVVTMFLDMFVFYSTKLVSVLTHNLFY